MRIASGLAKYRWTAPLWMCALTCSAALAPLGMNAAVAADDKPAAVVAQKESAAKPADEEKQAAVKKAREAAMLGLTVEEMDLKLPEDIFEIPASGNAELIAVARRLNSPVVLSKQKVTSFQEMNALRVKAAKAATEAATKVLADKDATEKQLTQATGLLVTSQLSLVRIDGENSSESAMALVTKLSKDERAAVSKPAADALFTLKVNSLPQLAPEAAEALLAEILENVRSSEFSQASIQQAGSAGQILERSANGEAKAAAFLTKLADVIEKADDEKVKALSSRFRGQARRLGLVGNEMQVVGTTVSGEKFDLASLKGKVVLVDFWATWCGPCVAEIPRVKSLYEGYHDQGFEVVGISLDNTIDPLKTFIEKREIPWVNLYPNEEEAKTNAGWKNSISSYYGVNAIPCCILIGADGKVISIKARGKVLEDELEKIFGKLPQKPADKEEKAQ